MRDDEQIIPAHKRFDKGDFFWLVYLFFFLIEPIDRRSLPFWAKSLAEVAVFIALYLMFLRFCDRSARLAMLGGMVILGLATYPHNGGATCFVIYAAALLPFLTSSIPSILTGLVGISAMLMAEGVLLHTSPYSWVSSVLLVCGVGVSNIFFAQKQRADRKLRLKQEEIEALAAVAERERIARDLHDVLGHTLSVIVLKSELAGRLLQQQLGHEAAAAAPSLERARVEVGEVEQTARRALAEVREAIGGYRARGLGAEIEAARHTLHAAGVRLQREEEAVLQGLSAAEETVLALALREAITNIVRHAGATTCVLSLRCERERYRLTIQDDGRARGLKAGNGLRGMRERVEALGGELVLQQRAGTRLEISLPLRAGASSQAELATWAAEPAS